MGANGQGEGRAARLARERALYQYSSALERGDFDAVAAVLHQAQTDEALERMILEVNEVYGAELGRDPVPGSEAERPVQRIGQRAAWRRRRGGDVADTKRTLTRRPLLGGRRVTPGWIAGGVVAAVLVTCLAAALVAGALRARSAGGPLLSSSADYDDYAPGLSAPQVVEEVVVEREGEAYGYAEEALAPLMEAGAGSRAAIQATVVASQPEQERLIIRTGSLTLRVEDTLAAQQAVEGLVARWSAEGAYVVSSEQRGGDDEEDPYISMAIRVPAARFGEAMDSIADLAVDVDSRIEDSDDVTEEYVDLAGRLEALEAARDRLLEIMSEADRTEDLLQAEEQLTRREAEIEATQGRMQYLSQSAALARISIQLQPYVLSQPVGQRWRPAETVREALEALLEGAQGLVDFLLFFSIAVLPWLLALALGLYLLYRVVRWAVRRQRARQAETEVG
jgi:hypothetical protein